MAQVLVENLNPILIHQLETLAKLHGRSLQEEIKHIVNANPMSFDADIISH